MMSSKKKVAMVLAGAAVLAGTGLVTVAHRYVSPGETVVEAVDGDTFFINNRQPVRLKGRDTGTDQSPSC